MSFYVYTHHRLDDGSCFYVGKGTKNRAYVKSTRNQYWKNIVNKHGYFVKIVIHNCPEKFALMLEQKLIAFYKKNNINLTNMTEGGEGVSGLVLSPETKAKISKKRKQRNTSINELVNLKQGPLKREVNFCFKGPNGKIYTGKNITQFAKENNLNYQHLVALKTGKRKSHKGWTLGATNE